MFSRLLLAAINVVGDGVRVGDENGFQAMKMAFKDFPPFPLTKSLCQSGVKKHSISA